MRRYDIIYYIYAIYFKSKIIYIGSTSDIEKREKSHNKNLKNRYKCVGGLDDEYLSDSLYDFCIKNKIENLELKEISKGYNDMVIISNGLFEWRRFIEEDKYIKYCLDKGCKLTNIVWSTYFDEDLVYRVGDNKIIDKNKNNDDYKYYIRKLNNKKPPENEGMK